MIRVVPGIHSAREALKIRPHQVKEIWLKESDSNADLEQIARTAASHRIKIHRKPLRALDLVVSSHQGVIAYVEGEPQVPQAQKLRDMERSLIFALDCLEDSHNVGSILRVAWNFGATEVLSAKDRSANQSPSAQKVACGGFEHVPFLEVSNLPAELKNLKELGFWIFGLDEKATAPIDQANLKGKCVLVVGGEEKGLRKATEGQCDSLVRIPQVFQTDSFNASIAAAIAGYEFVRQNPIPQNAKNSTKKL